MKRTTMSRGLLLQGTFITPLIAIALLGSAKVVNAQGPLAQPLAWKPLPVHYSKAPTEFTGYSTSGRIYEINSTTRNIAVISAKPFWAPKPPLKDRIALWPPNTLLIVQIPSMIPIIIDGKKVGFDQLTPGEAISVQYSIYVGFQLGCGARAIQGLTDHSVRPIKSSTEQR